MTLYLLGNLTGRLFASYLIVWLLMWLLPARREWRVAFRKAHRWYGLLAVVVLFTMGVLIAGSKGTLV